MKLSFFTQSLLVFLIYGNMAAYALEPLVQTGTNRNKEATLQYAAYSSIKNAKVPLIAEVYLPELSARIGDTVSIPVRFSNLDVAKRELSNLDIDGYMMHLRFKKSVATPVFGRRDSLAGEFRIVKQSGPINWSSDTLAVVHLIAGLGDSPSTPLILENFIWTRRGIPFTQAISSDGLLTISDIDTNNGIPRYLNTNPGGLKLEISPNPLRIESKIQISGFTSGATFSIYSITGEEIMKVPDPATSLINVTRAQFVKSGVYYCHLRSGEYSVTRVLRVE